MDINDIRGKTFVIRVEQRHIDAGEPGRCRTCPIALALQEMLGTDLRTAVRVGTHTTTVSADTGVCTVPVFALMPPKARNFIRDFDYYRYREGRSQVRVTFEPFEFALGPFLKEGKFEIDEELQH